LYQKHHVGPCLRTGLHTNFVNKMLIATRCFISCQFIKKFCNYVLSVLFKQMLYPLFVAFALSPWKGGRCAGVGRRTKQISQREARPHASSWEPRLHARARRQPEALRSLTATGHSRSPCVRSVATKNQPSCSSASCPSSVWCARSPRTSRPICVSRAAPWWPCRRRARPTWSDSSRTQTCAQSTQSASQSCPRTSSWHVAFAVSTLKRRRQPSFV